MNRLQGKVEDVRVSGHLSQVTVLLPGGTRLRAIVIDTPETASYLSGRGAVGVLFKETEVLLAASDGAAISVENFLKGRIEYIVAGELLCRVGLESDEGPITAVVAADSLKRLGLKEGGEVMALIPMNTIMLTES